MRLYLLPTTAALKTPSTACRHCCCCVLYLAGSFARISPPRIAPPPCAVAAAPAAPLPPPPFALRTGGLSIANGSGGGCSPSRGAIPVPVSTPIPRCPRPRSPSIVPSRSSRLGQARVGLPLLPLGMKGVSSPPGHLSSMSCRPGTPCCSWCCWGHDRWCRAGEGAGTRGS